MGKGSPRSTYTRQSLDYIHPRACAATAQSDSSFTRASCPRDGVIPKPRASASGARDLPLVHSICSFVTDTINHTVLKKIDAPSQTILRLHHDQWTKTRHSLHGRDGQSPPPRLAAQEQADTGLYQPLQPNPPRLLRMLFLSGRGDQSGRGNQSVATRQEDKAHRIDESALGGPGARMAGPVQTGRSSLPGDPSLRLNCGSARDDASCNHKQPEVGVIPKPRVILSAGVLQAER